MMGLAGRERILTISSAAWIQYTNVTDRRTGGQTPSDSKNCTYAYTPVHFTSLLKVWRRNLETIAQSDSENTLTICATVLTQYYQCSDGLRDGQKSPINIVRHYAFVPVWRNTEQRVQQQTVDTVEGRMRFMYINSFTSVTQNVKDKLTLCSCHASMLNAVVKCVRQAFGRS